MLPWIDCYQHHQSCKKEGAAEYPERRERQFGRSPVQSSPTVFENGSVAALNASAEAQAEATKEAQRAGIAYAQANDDGTKFRGRKPTFNFDSFAHVRHLLSQGTGVAEIARATGLKRQTIYRIKRQPEKQAAALAAWYPDLAAA